MIRLALIGCGGMGGVHQGAIKQLEGRAEIAATVDIVEERAKRAADNLGCEKWATDYHDILNDIDAGIVVLPHHLHHPVGIELLRNGKHVLMEKPLANTEDECLDLIDTARGADRTLMVAYCMRYHPLLVEIERLIRKKEYGDVFQLSIWTEQHTQGEPGSWMHRKETVGGGQLFSHGCHYIDILLAWMGSPEEGFHIGTNFGTPWMECEGTSNVSMKFENGALGYHFGTWGAKGTRLNYSIHAHCTEGMLEAQISKGLLLLHRGGAEEEGGRERVLLETRVSKDVGKELIHFIECLEKGETPLTDAARSLQSLRVIWRMYAAEKKGTVADLRGLGLDDAP